MRLCVLGGVEAVAGRRRTAFPSERQRTILAAVTAARGEVVSSDRLVEGLWGARPPPSAHKTLLSHVSKLRRTLQSLAPAGGDVLVTTPEGYRLDLGACELDASRFEGLLTEARRQAATDPQRAVERFAEAEGLWRGPAFGDLAAHVLVRPEARRLELLRSAAAADRVDGQLAAGRHHEVIAELEAAVDRELLDERAHGQLMTALYRAGRQAEALATYRRLRDRLGEELGIDPTEDLQRLHERILRQDADLDIPPGPPTGARRAAATDPAADLSDTGAGAGPRSGLVGRDEDLAAVLELVASSGLVTLTGTGGVGKTRLAEQVAVAAAGPFPDGGVVCPLAAVHDPASVAPALLDALGARHQGGRPAEETLIAAVGGRRLLLVVDACEHLLPAVSPLIASLLAACPAAAVLATSREPLRLPGERVWQVAPLAVPPAGATAATVMAAPAGALFVQRAQAADPGFLLDDDGAAVGELCRRLDGIPLALELAAARVRALSPAALLERLDQRFALLTGGPDREAGRHRTLHAVVDWSYAALGEAEARLFDRLSVFAGPFPLDAAEAVCRGAPLADDEVAGRLAELVDKSLVTVDREDGGRRYRLLDTLRVYGAARLAETGEAERYRQAHATYHVAFAEAHGPRLRGTGEREAVTALDRAVDDLRVAHAWLVAAGEVDGALRLPVALRDYMGHRQRDEMVTWTERALDLPGAAAHPAYPAALATAARGATRRGDLARARRHADAALRRAEPTSLAATWARHALATVALYEGRLDDVLALTGQRAPLAEASGEDYYRAMATMLRVLARQYRGETGNAAAEAEQLCAAADASGNDAMRAWARYCHGEVLLDADPAAAAPLLERAIELARRAETRIPEGVAMVSLASLCTRTGELGRAVELFAEVVAHWRRLGDWTHQLTALRNLVELLVRLCVDEPAAALHAAVSNAAPPSFGAEADRLAAAGRELESRLGRERAAAAAARGRRWSPAQMADEALAVLDEIAAGEAAPG